MEQFMLNSDIITNVCSFLSPYDILSFYQAYSKPIPNIISKIITEKLNNINVIVCCKTVPMNNAINCVANGFQKCNQCSKIVCYEHQSKCYICSKFLYCSSCGYFDTRICSKCVNSKCYMCKNSINPHNIFTCDSCGVTACCECVNETYRGMYCFNCS